MQGVWAQYLVGEPRSHIPCSQKSKNIKQTQYRHKLNTFLAPYPKVLCMCAKSLQSCLTLCNAMDCSPPGSSVHGILQARILEAFALLQRIFPTWGLNQHLLLLLHGQAGSLPLVAPGEPTPRFHSLAVRSFSSGPA